MIERILGAAFLISVIIREFLWSNSDQLIFLSGTSLAFTYFFANWWISKPKESNVRTITLTVLYGFAACTLTLSLIFHLLFYAGAQLLSILSIAFLILVLGLDFISSYKQRAVLTSSTTWRFAILTTLVVAFYMPPLKNQHQELDKSPMADKYLAFDTTYTSHEAFNDSICKVAIDSANNRFKRNKFELYVFYDSDSSATPIQLLRTMFRMQTITFAREDFVFKFCYNDAMVTAFKNHHHFNPIDSVKIIYDSLLKIGQTQANAKFPGGIEEFERYITCNLEFPEGVNLSPPYPTVRVSFRVSPTGYPDEIEITKSHSSKYDSAVLKMIKSMPKWIPAQGDYGTYEANHIQWNCSFDPVKKEEDCR